MIAPATFEVYALPNAVTATPRSTPRVVDRRALAARYDAAQTNPDNIRHWGAADNLSANAANSPGIRRTLRSRARYEIANNGYGHGIIETLANYVIGTGPRLQVNTGDERADRKIERRFARWARRVKLAQKLWLMRFSAAASGEAFAVISTNRRSKDPVQLDLRVIECDRVTDPSFTAVARKTDGVVKDDFGNPVAYTILRYHPGDALHGATDDYDTVRAEFVLHLFKATRPEQDRGIPEMTPTLGLFAELRRYTQAVIAAAETAADFAGVIQTTAPPVDGAAAIEPFDSVEIERRMLVTMPEGWAANQMRAEQPTTTYPQFKGEVLSEAGRPFNMPYNIAAAKSAGYNFASAKLDFATFHKAIGIDQFRVEEAVLEPLFEQFWNEAKRVDGYLPEIVVDGEVEIDPLDDDIPPHEWMWDGQEQLDPRESASKATGLAAGIDTLPRLFAAKGLDYETEQINAAKALGLTVDEYRRLLVMKTFGNGNAMAAPAGDAMDPEDDAMGDTEDDA